MKNPRSSAIVPRHSVSWIAGVFLLATCGIRSPLLAHNASITRIDVKVEAQELAVTVGLNQSDVMEHVLKVVNGPGRFADRQEYEDAAAAVRDYVIRNLRLSADGKPLAAPAAPQWPGQRAELTHIDATGLEVPSVLPLTLRYSLPPGARKIVLEPRLFSAANFAASFVVTVYREGGATPISAVIDKHEPVAFELDAPSPVRPEAAPLVTEKPASHFLTPRGVAIVSTIVVLICIAICTYPRKRGESGKKCDE